MKVELLRYPAEADWLLAKQCALITVGKWSTKPPTEKFRRGILRARHSPIRELKFVFLMTDIPYWVSGHLVRHIHSRPYVGSQRNDRQTKYDRDTAPQNAPVNMIWSMEAEELITIANKRLCGKASAKTREVVQMMRDEVAKVCPEVAEQMVPMCARNGGICYEMEKCGKGAGT